MLRLLAAILPPKMYLWLRYRFDKYLGIKGMNSAKILHHYWKNPPLENSPANYLPSEKGNVRSALIVKSISKHGNQNDEILELGSNLGRNLKFLKDNGFSCLSGVEINEKAIRMMESTFPDLWETSRIEQLP